MIFVLFEVTVRKEYMQDYLSLAAGLKNELEQVDGYLRSERFSSLNNEGKLLSLSVWKNEQAVEKWRNNIQHRMCQRQGHDLLFEDYTIIVTAKIRSYTRTDRAEVPEDSEMFLASEPEDGSAGNTA
uniref:antibiotic biosynthesis monooxygenase family protein n=1 Tax=Castellaniella defragrans TaxID=75697 RepID=UPI00333F746D